MKKSLIILLSLAIFSCGEKKETTSNTENPSVAKPETANRTLKKDARKMGPAKSEEQKNIEASLKNIENQGNELLGCWVGSFGTNKITLFVAEINGKDVSGHSVCAGNYRKMTGQVEDQGNGTHTFVLNEPGDNKYDGKFEFSIDENKKRLEGKWAPFNDKSTAKKTYALDKKEFKYESNIGKYPEASTRILTVDDVSNRTEDELKYMRNEIYARHGYSFKTKAIREMFDKLDWYIPVSIDVRDQLTETELANIDLIYEYETYYKESYDDYGR